RIDEQRARFLHQREERERLEAAFVREKHGGAKVLVAFMDLVEEHLPKRAYPITIDVSPCRTPRRQCRHPSSTRSVERPDPRSLSTSRWTRTGSSARPTRRSRGTYSARRSPAFVREKRRAGCTSARTAR